MKVISVHLPEPFLEAIDLLVKQKKYVNRSEAIRVAVRDFIYKELGKIPPTD